MLGEKKGAWVDELPGVLWAYKTSHKIATGEILFALAIGHEFVVPVEIRAATHRSEHFDEHENNDKICLNLNLLTEMREQASFSRLPVEGCSLLQPEGACTTVQGRQLGAQKGESEH